MAQKEELLQHQSSSRDTVVKVHDPYIEKEVEELRKENHGLHANVAEANEALKEANEALKEEKIQASALKTQLEQHAIDLLDREEAIQQLVYSVFGTIV